MSEKKNVTVQEPLFHLAKRSAIAPARAWLIRLAAIVLGLLVCGVAAFVLIEKLQIFADIITQQNIALLPRSDLPEAYNLTEVVDITAQPL